MPIRTFSIRTLFVLIFTFGVSLVALTTANEVWAALFTTLVVVLLLVALVGALFHEENRSFWSGVSIFGWGYLFLIYGWLTLSDRSMLTTTVLWEMAAAIGNAYTPIDVPSYPYMLAQEQGPTPDFLRIGHALWAAIFAISGGVIARSFATIQTDECQRT